LPCHEAGIDNPAMRLTQMRHLANVALLLLFNTAIAVLVSVLSPQLGFSTCLLLSQCIGLSVALVNAPVVPRIAPGWRRWLALGVTLPASVLLGIVVAYALLGRPFAITPMFWRSAVVGMMFAVIGSIVFILAERIHDLDAEVRQRRLAEAERARRELEAHLKLLQAQIEPHFLFNSLANVASLIETDAARARQLLDRLNDWLRVALARARGERASLGDELALLENWLEILALRFGPRLAWHIEASAEARACDLPPMLLQPLLENAVKHGIEPKVGGGRVDLIARVEGGRLRIEVRDDGAGLGTGVLPSPPGGGAGGEGSQTGTGLANVRARLAALYGDAGHLALVENPNGGVTASLELPCAR
jgi:sensor histidine kinase YesM